MDLILPPKIAKSAFQKCKVPDSLYSKIMNEYSMMSFNNIKDDLDNSYSLEFGVPTVGAISVNGMSNPYYNFCQLPEDLYEECFETITPIVEEWSGCKVNRSYGYGIRSYIKDSILHLHRDKYNTHILSCIIFVDQNSKENWPLDFFDHEHKHHKVFFEPGDMLLYESLCVHGRITPFNGEYYRNMYFHWKPRGWNPCNYAKMKSSFTTEEYFKIYEKS